MLAMLGTSAEPGRLTILHHFAGSGGGGLLIVSGSTLYGTTDPRWIEEKPKLFKINTDGSGYTVLREGPVRPKILIGSTFYGTAPHTVIRMNTDGSGFTELHKFTDKSIPCAMVISNSVLYGVTAHGGSRNVGSLFKVNCDGSGFTNLYSFEDRSYQLRNPILLEGRNGKIFRTYATCPGYDPCHTLAISGSDLYGMTQYGGGWHGGVLFRINCDGSGFTNLYYPYVRFDRECSLTLAGTNIYATTAASIFKINTDGSGYTNLHSFIGGIADGATPYGPLVLSGSSIYGVTRRGGSHGGGVVFRINCDGSGYTNLHSFVGVFEARDYVNTIHPDRGLVLSGTSLYGVTQDVLKYGLGGVIFKVNIAP
jgi:uncharacterized repeat protein (TIGR03803 family)